MLSVAVREDHVPEPVEGQRTKQQARVGVGQREVQALALLRQAVPGKVQQERLLRRGRGLVHRLQHLTVRGRIEKHSAVFRPQPPQIRVAQQLADAAYVVADRGQERQMGIVADTDDDRPRARRIRLRHWRRLLPVRPPHRRRAVRARRHVRSPHARARPAGWRGLRAGPRGCVPGPRGCRRSL